MTQSQINYFLAAAAEGSITRAANRLLVSQPAISKSIASLEQELGFLLFNRRDNAIELTRAGRLLYEFFTRSKDEYHQILRSIGQESGEISSLIRIGCPSSWNLDLFYTKVESCISAKFPALQMSFSGLLFMDLIAMLKNGHLDMALAFDLYDTARLGLRARRIASAGCGLLYSKRYFKHVRSIMDFRHTAFLIYDNNIQYRYESMIRELCRDKFLPKIKNFGNAFDTVFETSRGTGVMFLTDWDSIVRSDLFGFLPVDVALGINVLFPEDSVNPYVGAIAESMTELFFRDPDSGLTQ